MGDIYKNIEECNPKNKLKLLIVFDDMSTNMLSNKKLNQVTTELFIRGKELNIYLVFVAKFYFAVPKNVLLSPIHYFIMKIPNRGKLQIIVFNHLSDIEFKDFTNLYKKWTAKPCSFLVVAATVGSDTF